MKILHFADSSILFDHSPPPLASLALSSSWEIDSFLVRSGVENYAFIVAEFIDYGIFNCNYFFGEELASCYKFAFDSVSALF